MTSVKAAVAIRPRTHPSKDFLASYKVFAKRLRMNIGGLPVEVEEHVVQVRRAAGHREHVVPRRRLDQRVHVAGDPAAQPGAVALHPVDARDVREVGEVERPGEPQLDPATRLSAKRRHVLHRHQAARPDDRHPARELLHLIKDV
jgi:hypothetical protein